MAATLLICITPCYALAANRLIDEEPTDLITLKDGQTLVVAPLELPQRRLPEDRTTGKLRVRLVDKPTLDFEVGWGSIRKVDLFEQRVLAEAEQYTADGNFDDAFDNYAFVLQNYPDTDGIKESIRRFLKLEATSAFRAQEYDRALMILLELSEHDPGDSAIAGSLDRVGDKLVSQYFEEQNYDRARGVIRLLKKTFPNRPYPNLDIWQQRIIQKAETQLDKARGHATASEFREANLAIQTAQAIWPALPGIQELSDRIRKAYPQIVVGVTASASDQPTTRLDDGGSRRARRLLMRTLLELTDYGSEGGVYHCPLGELSLDVSGRQITIRLDDGIQWSSGAGQLTGHDVARQLLRLTEPKESDYDRDWAAILGGISVKDVYEVQIDLQRSHVRPDALTKKSVDGTARFTDR